MSNGFQTRHQRVRISPAMGTQEKRFHDSVCWKQTIHFVWLSFSITKETIKRNFLAFSSVNFFIELVSMMQSSIPPIKTKEDFSTNRIERFHTHGSMYTWMKKKCKCEICTVAKNLWSINRNQKRRKSSQQSNGRRRLAQNQNSVGSNPSCDTNLWARTPMAERFDLKSKGCGFDSHCAYNFPFLLIFSCICWCLRMTVWTKKSEIFKSVIIIYSIDMIKV